MPRYSIVIEAGRRNCSAYAPDVPGCVATGPTVEQTRQRMAEALTLHLEALRRNGEPLPEPAHGPASTGTTFVEV